ncbi:MAG: DEAD/DEAH box helicase [Candidatus Micrarchaeota archaeon]
MSFENLGLQPGILKAITELGFKEPTDIQREAIPLLLQGSDLIGQARTGTGKTAAFAISILETLQPKNHVQALILVPTRELAMQVVAEFEELGKYVPHSTLAIYGGEDIQKQLRRLQKGVQIAVCTPGRLLDHLERKSISLAQVHTVVLDEADRMLDMGFIDDIRRILSHAPPKRQMMLFSATMPGEIVSLAQQYLHKPETVNVSADKITVESISQHYIMSDPRHKMQILLHLLRERKPRLSIFFVRTKRGADNLFYSLERNGMKAALLHGNLTQSRRDRSMHDFRNLHSNILVATDIASRGIDVDDVDLIVNYNLPEDALIYAHRIGRTARAGKAGEAISFVSNVEELRSIQQFSTTLHCQIPEMKIEGLKLPEIKDDEYRGFGKRPEHMGRHGGGEGEFRGRRPTGSHGGGRPHGGQGNRPQHAGRGRPQHRQSGSHSSHGQHSRRGGSFRR